MMAEAIGQTGHNIMFSSNMTPAEDFVKAAELGAIINFDDITHIPFFEKLAPIPETVCCRFNPGGVFQVSNDIMDHPGDAKYGMTKTQLKEAFSMLKEKGAKHFGIHSFLASSTKSNDYYPMLAKILFELAVELKNELDILSGGQLEYAVTVHGSDEIGELALGIDQMRRSILKHQELEDQMRTANSELITAMSHDLRTPLTSLLAYLEIIERQKYTDDTQRNQLIHKSIQQTLRIKNMADQLFEYFLVYATDWESEPMETIDADPLFLQILEDYAYSLESSGMQVQLQFTPVSGRILATIQLLQRALDNLYSNLTKYASPEETIRICYEKQENSLYLSITNGSRTEHSKQESTSIGLNTRRRIIEYHGGTFETAEKNGRFFVSVTLPLQT